MRSSRASRGSGDAVRALSKVPLAAVVRMVDSVDDEVTPPISSLRSARPTVFVTNLRKSGSVRRATTSGATMLPGRMAAGVRT